MLIITRRQGEVLVIRHGQHEIRITSLGGRCRLGIDAPAAVKVDRQECRPRLKAG